MFVIMAKHACVLCSVGGDISEASSLAVVIFGVSSGCCFVLWRFCRVWSRCPLDVAMLLIMWFGVIVLMPGQPMRLPFFMAFMKVEMVGLPMAA